MKLPILIKTVAIVSIFLSFGCRADDVMKAEFRTLAECLKSIEKNTNSSLTIIRDKPEIVTGNLDNGKPSHVNEKKAEPKEHIMRDGSWLINPYLDVSVTMLYHFSGVF